MDYYHGHAKCQGSKTVDRISKLVHGVPHGIARDWLDLTGYGISARQVQTIYRLAMFALITQGACIAFAAW